MRNHLIPSIVTAITLAGAAMAQADTLTWQRPASSASGKWGDNANWLNSSSAADHPGVGDLAQLTVGSTGWAYVDIEGGGAVGSITATPEWTQNYRIYSGWGGTTNFTVDNAGSDSVFTIHSHSSNSGYTAELLFGTDGGGTFKFQLNNNLVIQNSAGNASSGRVGFGSHAVVAGGSAAARRTITIQSLGNSGVTAQMQSGSTATFVGDWVVTGDKAKLVMKVDQFGDASNSVTLTGGTLDVNALSGFMWNRSLSGTGTVYSPTNGFVIDTGSYDVLASGTTVDLLNITGALTLNPDSVLNVTGSLAPGDYLIMQSDTSRAGTFGTENLGPNMSVIYGADSVTLHVAVPEPATLALLAIGGLLAGSSRRRRA